MNKLYLIESENDYIINQEITKILKTTKNQDDLTIIKYDLSDISLEKIIEELDTYDLFLKQKIVICKNPLFLEEKQEINEEKFLKYLKNPSDNILILITKKINNRLKIASLIKEYFQIISSNLLNLNDYLKNNLENYQMDNQTRTYFLNKVSQDINLINQELVKLKSYKLETKIILKEDIDLITNKSFEATIFDLIEAIIKKDKTKTYELYNYFLNNGTEIFQIMVLLANQIRLIYNVKILALLSDLEISKILDVKEYPVKLARKKGFTYKSLELLTLLYNLALLDEDIKSGKQLIEIAFLTFIMKM